MERPADIVYRPLSDGDFSLCLDLWRSTPGVGLSSSDNPEAFSRFLGRNQGLSFAAVSEGAFAGTVMCGHDGRRGYLYHLAVGVPFRRRGIGTRLVDLALEALRGEGIDKCTLFVFGDNESGKAFWSAAGWTRRTDLLVWQKEP